MLRYLLSLDPADGQVEPRRGRWSLATRISKRRNAIDLTLLQMTTGLRVSEANAIIWSRHVETSDDGAIHVTVTKDISKTKRERRVPVLDDRVAERVFTRMNGAPSQAAHVIGSPADPMVEWDRRNCGGEVAKLYAELAEALDIDLLRTARTHVWRTTLNSMLLNDVPEVVRAAFFGHDGSVNRGSYTDLTDTSSMVAAARRLRAI
ncbi:tyrosine-type recombinase/integrase [Mycetocola zhujimingii]|uniref:tyrosine-type recombinase/integrase n=1 Tax=Mycetocola zhujimingii TaxID=2079792 RepID=UPI0013C46FD0|nr:tyrosine-type recombinase/integrase [Mycetocola zhujimingii]